MDLGGALEGFLLTDQLIASSGHPGGQENEACYGSSDNTTFAADLPVQLRPREVVEAAALKEAMADLTLENRLHKNLWPAPSARVLSLVAEQSAQTYPVSRAVAVAKMELRAVWS